MSDSPPRSGRRASATSPSCSPCSVYPRKNKKEKKQKNLSWPGIEPRGLDPASLRPATRPLWLGFFQLRLKLWQFITPVLFKIFARVNMHFEALKISYSSCEFQVSKFNIRPVTAVEVSLPVLKHHIYGCFDPRKWNAPRSSFTTEIAPPFYISMPILVTIG